LKSIDIKTDNVFKATVTIITLEDKVIECEWSVGGGIKVNKIDSKEANQAKVYEDINTLLHDLSPGYGDAFNNELM
jgi:hypothetical protein